MDVKNYFQSYRDYFWGWTTDEDVPDVSGYSKYNLVTFPEIGSVAYRPYIIEVLKEIQPQGFPPFGSLLLALYATQDGFLDLEDLFKRINQHPVAANRSVGDHLTKAFEFLGKLRSLDKVYKKGRNRIVLFQTVFKRTYNHISAGNADQILKTYSKRSYEILDCAGKKELMIDKFNEDFKILALINIDFPTVQSVIDAMIDVVDIPELENKAVEEETTLETDKDFIQELIEEPKTFQVGSLIKRIWSGLKIPMRHLSSGEQPIGGVSDMTNKGDFSRMLLSEFANEDEVFMNRVASNEALYIQREIPPEENVFERIILIDTSLKNWGTPKVLAFAAAVAVFKHPKANSQYKVFALGQNIIPINLDRVEEVIENLNHVSPVLEVSDTLEKFFNDEHSQKDPEVFFITHQENLNNQNLQKVIHENRDGLKFLITTSTEGELNFYKHHKGTRKHIQKMMLPLQELWADPPKRKNRHDQNKSSEGRKTDVPLNYPLLFPTPQNKIESFLLEGEFLILSSKKQLLKTYLSDNYYNKNYYEQYRTHRGCEVLFENISVKPTGQFALAKNRRLHYILCQYQPDKKLISKLNLNTGEYSETNVSLVISLSDLVLTYFNQKFYLWNENAERIEQMNTDGIIALESVKNNRDIQKNYYKAAIELKRLFTYYDDKILSNCNRIAINRSCNLVVSQFALQKKDENSLRMHRNKDEIIVYAQKVKNKFVFSEGSEIIADPRGILTFKSANSSVSVFYLTTTTNGFLAMASTAEFAGSEYYLPETTRLKIKTLDQMYSEYLETFIHQIVEYGTEN